MEKYGKVYVGIVNDYSLSDLARTFFHTFLYEK